MRVLLSSVFFFYSTLYAQVAGEMDYNTTSNEFEFYNGTSWLSTLAGDSLIGCGTAGSMRYNSVSGQQEFCDGSTWKIMLGLNTLSACGNPGALEYNTTSNKFQVCNGLTNTWWDLGLGGGGSDVTPDAINWADFTNVSTTETITGIDTTITLEISAVDGTGTPTYQYSKNGGAWTTFTTATPASVSIANNDTLALKLLDDDGESGTITVTNTSDGNATLDTAVGSYDPCYGVTPGQACEGTTALYVGSLSGNQYMVTPGNCTDSATPTCDGAVDSVQKIWGPSGNISGVQNFLTKETYSNEVGAANTAGIVAVAGGGTAAEYCDAMSYGGYTDWFLPDNAELSFLYCRAAVNLGDHQASNPEDDPDCVARGGKTYQLPGFRGSRYWSSSQYWLFVSNGWSVHFNGTIANTILEQGRGDLQYVRCVRKYTP